MSYEGGSVTVSLEELKKGISFDVLERAFGQKSLGIIVVKDLPQEYYELRLKVLSAASILAKLPKHELERMENEEATWLIGWSLGKEKLNGKPDLFKGSYYINCSFYKDFNKEGPISEEIVGFDKYKAYTCANLWPSQELMPNFVMDCKRLINLIISVSIEVAKNCDRYCLQNIENYKPRYLETIVEKSYTTKARLLHYYPLSDSALLASSDDDSDWCGEHLDHSCLTGLTSALFINEETGEILPNSPDSHNSGLFIKDRKGQAVKISIPIDCLAFQTGSCLQEVSNNRFKAVPHFVKNFKDAKYQNIARNTLAVFCQPSLSDMVNETENFAQYSSRILMGNHD
ncbi:hypothetical protein PACTADRAFT_36921 [Pachysolen tannophilus NRRL Y-2460]|uniref:Isopenicillin N synthase-like Fe(2+) 2OG dioxygenase domain-containing protein n=1 Tax=Pachysolen tannophilus NRRL Y-2460 TaxID=669874 RepID=A0A1E4U2C5_PACTA|nr:hypothetical protein PACTADRAFT_36921 [Pachysolen tannophilus NRRL Y-2460]